MIKDLKVLEEKVMEDKPLYQYKDKMLTLPELALLSGSSKEDVMEHLKKGVTVAKIVDLKKEKEKIPLSIDIQIKSGDTRDLYTLSVSVPKEFLDMSKSRIINQLVKRLVVKYFYR